MLKKITAILMVILMVGSLAACSTKEASGTPENQTTPPHIRKFFNNRKQERNVRYSNL